MSRRCCKRSAAAAALVLLCLPAAGQALPQVTISTTRTEAAPFDVPASVDVIEGERLRGAARPEVQLSESLAIVPGLVARDRQNQAQDLQLSIRGFGARSTFGVRGVRLYIDGIPATLPDGQGQLAHFDLGALSHVEVLRGPFSALYGNSSGGVLQVFTEKGEGPPVLSSSMVVGSDGLLKPALRASGAAAGLGFNLGVSRLRLDGAREHSGAERAIGHLRLDGSAGEGRRWTLLANAMDLRAEDPLGLTRAQLDARPGSADAAALAFDTRKTVRQAQLGFVHEAALGVGTLRWMAYGGERSTVQFQAIPVAAQASALHPGGVIDLNRRYFGTDLRWTVRSRMAGGHVDWVAGLAWDRLDEARRGWQNFSGSALGVQGALRRDERNEVSNLDPYLQATWAPSPAWMLTAGVRHSRVRFDSRDRYIVGANADDSGSVAYGATLPALGARYTVAEGLQAYAAWGRGFETPTFNELSYRPHGQPGLNFGLRPSRSRNLELGLKGRLASPRLEWSAAWFGVRTRDEIVVQTNLGGRSTFRNAAATQRRGLELALAARPAPHWELRGAHTWLDARYRDAFAVCSATPCPVPNVAIPAGNRIPGIARHVTALELDYMPPQGWRGGLEWRRSGRVFVNDANSDAARAWNTLALHAGYAWQARGWRWRAAARVDNLFDRRYAGSVIVGEGNGRFFEPAPGRQFTFKLTASHPF